MSAEAFSRDLPEVVTLDDLAVMNDVDQHGHRYEMSPEGARAGIPRYWVADRDAATTVTLYRLRDEAGYQATDKLALAWLLQTSPADHLPSVA